MDVEGDLGAGAVFVGTRDGDLNIYRDAARASAAMEAVDVEDGEYTAAFRVDGAVLAPFTEGEGVLLDLTGGVDRAGLAALIEDYAALVQDHAARALFSAGGGAALEVAQAWLTREWQRRSVRWPRWLDRRLHGLAPPSRGELAAPPGEPRPRLVHARQVREVVEQVLAALPPAAVEIDEDLAHGRAVVELRPRAPGAVEVMLLYNLSSIDVMVGRCPAIEITAPRNINYAPPHQQWARDVREVLDAVSEGSALITYDQGGQAVGIEIPGSRLGAQAGPSANLVTRHPPPWR